MSIPHYTVWLRNEGGFALPPDCHVALRFHRVGKFQRYVINSHEFGSRQQCVFRHMQNCKWYDKIRTVPTCLVFRLGETKDYSDFAANYAVTYEEVWHRLINWQQVICQLVDIVHREFPAKTAGVDITETPS